jgi:branched-chain amino acid transport system permease protein
MMEQFLQQLASGVANGAVYACLALALSIVFVSTGHINFAQGEMAMFSAFVCWQLVQWGLGFWLALPLTIVATFLVGALVQWVILRPLGHSPTLAVVVVFIGLLAICHSLAEAIWTATIKQVPSPFAGLGIAPASGIIGPHQLGMIAVTVVMLAALYGFFRFTDTGLAMRAAAQNPQSARHAGIPVDRMLALGWGLAAALGAIAGILIAPVVYLEPNMMTGVLLYGFAGGLVGGISNPGGAVAGGFILGILENVIAFIGNAIERSSQIYLFGNGEKLTVALLVVVAMVTWRPAGLFGRAAARRV